MMPKRLAVFTSICKEDLIFKDQYLTELERLDLHFVIHLDRCAELISEFINHRLCRGVTTQTKEVFNEKHKAGMLSLLSGLEFDWAIAMDVDETWDINAPDYLNLITNDYPVPFNRTYTYYDQILCPWVNLWNSEDTIRIDGSLRNSKRVKFYNLTDRVWYFDNRITNGARLISPNRITTREINFDLRCIHHGLKTKELREQHKERWDNIYSIALKGDKNPYGIWQYLCDETITPELKSLY